MIRESGCGTYRLRFSVAFSPDGGRLVSGAHDRTVRLWDINNGQQLRCLHGHEGEVRSVAFASDGRRIVSAGGFQDNVIKLWDADAGEDSARLRGPRDDVWALAFSPRGDLFASGSTDGTVRVWSAGCGHELSCLNGHERSIVSVAFSPDGCKIVSGGSIAVRESSRRSLGRAGPALRMPALP